MIEGILGSAVNTALKDWHSARQDFGNLVSSIKAGALTEAQGAFADLSSVTSQASTSGTTSSTTSTTSSSVQGGLAAVGQALSNGDMTGAQQALVNLFNTALGAHHHSATTASASSTATTTASAASDSGSTVSLLA